MLAARRLTSHSHGPGSVSSKSLTSNTSVRSGEANTPKFDRCASPQHWTGSPDRGVAARSCAMIMRRAAVEGEWGDEHPPVADRDQFRHARPGLALEQLHRISARGQRLEQRMAPTRYLFARRPSARHPLRHRQMRHRGARPRAAALFRRLTVFCGCFHRHSPSSRSVAVLGTITRPMPIRVSRGARGHRARPRGPRASRPTARRRGAAERSAPATPRACCETRAAG